jgi:NAD(P)H-nitrite reductase large subunit
MKFTTVVKDYADVNRLNDDDYICYCTKVDKRTIVDAIEQGASTLKAIKKATTACTGDECAILNPNKRCCSKEINQLIKLNIGERKMDKKVFKTAEGVKIAFTGDIEKQSILKMVENCATGSCECMTDETKEKITNMEVSGKDGEVNLDLTGEVSKEEIEAALKRSKVINN